MIFNKSIRASNRSLPHVFMVLLCLLFGTSKKAICQTNFEALKIGDQVPDVSLVMLNYSKESIRLTEFKGKAIILDFWATWCSPCVASFPKMDSLQSKFGDRLQILSVTYQDRQTVDLLFKKMNRNSAHKIKVPATVINDKWLSRLFPHTALPHYVWIGSDGVVKAITDMHQVTEENIRAFLNATTVFVLPVKNDTHAFINTKRPVFFVNPQIELTPGEILSKNELPYQSVLTRFRPEIQGGGCPFDSNRIFAYNLSIKWLFQFAFSQRKPEFLSDNRVILDVKDSSLVTYTGDENDLEAYERWRAEHEYCYEVIAPVDFDKSSKMGLEFMQADLSCYFSRMGISAKKEMMKRKCYVLRKADSTISLATKGAKASIQKNAFYYKLTNKPLTTLLNDLRAYYWQLSPLPLKDETGLKEPIDIEINAKMSSVEDVSKEFARYGLVLSVETREMEMIIITQR